MIFLCVCVAVGVVAVALLCADHTESWVCVWMWAWVSEWVCACLCMVFLECSHSSVLHCRVSPFCTEFIESICLFMYLGNMRTQSIFEYASHLNYTHTPFMCTYSFLSSHHHSSLFPDFIGISFPYAWKFMIFWYANGVHVSSSCVLKQHFTLYLAVWMFAPCVLKNAIKNSFCV